MTYRASALALYATAMLSGAVTASAISAGTGVIELERKTLSEGAVYPRAVHSLPEIHGPAHYWYGNFTVGETKDALLLIDTGSADLILNTGVYKPSSKSTPYGPSPHNFSITYEGVNAAGGGFETIKGKVYKDVVTAAGLTANQHAVGNSTFFRYKDAPQLKSAYQGNGIVGFSRVRDSSFNPQSPSWFQNLCIDKVVKACRFGVVFENNKRGKQVLGSVDKSLFNGPLTVTPSAHDSWITVGDVVLNGKVLFKNQTMFLDTGTNNVQGPVEQVKKIFNMLGFHYVEKVGGPNPFFPQENITTVTGYFPCNKPPTLGMSFPSEAFLKNPPKGPISKHSKTFNIMQDVWPFKDLGNNNCTTVLYGTNALRNPKFHSNAWLLGQAFYQGHYIDHNFDANTLSFADLKTAKSS